MITEEAKTNPSDNNPLNGLDCVVISGAGQGIGQAVALSFATTPLDILCISKTTNCKATAAQLNSAGSRAEGLPLDISDIESTRSSVADWIRRRGCRRIGLVLAASVLGPRDASDLRGWEHCLRVNLLGNLAIVDGALPTMVENKFGRIVGFGGGGAAYGYPLFPAYAASKTATVRTIENIQLNLDQHGDFAAVCLAPGANETNMLKEVRAAGAEIKTTVRLEEPVAFVREFLLSQNCGFKGAFVHVRDNWRDYLNTGKRIDAQRWKLRRTEP